MAVGACWNLREETIWEIVALIDSIRLDIKELRQLNQPRNEHQRQLEEFHPGLGQNHSNGNRFGDFVMPGDPPMQERISVPITATDRQENRLPSEKSESQTGEKWTNSEPKPMVEVSHDNMTTKLGDSGWELVDFSQELGDRIVFEEMPSEDLWANLGADQNDCVCVNPSFQKKDRNTLGKPPEESNQDSIQERSKACEIISSPLKTLSRGNELSSKPDFQTPTELYFTETLDSDVAYTTMSELTGNSFGLGMDTIRKISVNRWRNYSARQVFVEMLDRGFSWENMTFDPGILDMSLPKWSSSVLALLLKGDQTNIVNACCSGTILVDPCSRFCLIFASWVEDVMLSNKRKQGAELQQSKRLVFDPGGGGCDFFCELQSKIQGCVVAC